MVLRDIWGASYRDVEAVARFMLEALIESALSQAPAGGRRRPTDAPVGSRPAPKPGSHVPSRRGNARL